MFIKNNCVIYSKLFLATGKKKYVNKIGVCVKIITNIKHKTAFKYRKHFVIYNIEIKPPVKQILLLVRL